MSELETKKIEAFNSLRRLMGYVENGSDTSVTIYQDDATHTYHLKIGYTKPKTYWGNSLFEVIDKAMKDNPEEVL